MNRRMWAETLVAGFLSTLVCTAGSAAASAIRQPDVVRLRAVGRLATWQLGCAVRAARKGEVTDDRCLAKLRNWFDAAYAAPEVRCGSEAGGAAAAAAVENLRNALETLITPSGDASTCAAAKLRVAANQVRAAADGSAVSEDCRRAGAMRGRRALAQAEQFGDCVATDDAGPISAAVEEFVETVADGISALEGCPANLSVQVSGPTVELTWSGAAPWTGYTHVRVLRRLNVEPAGPNDEQATGVFFGSGGSAAHATAALLPNAPGNERHYVYTAYGCTADGRCEANGTTATLGLPLVDALRLGGYVIHWRHAAADVCADDLGLGKADGATVPDWWRSCDSNCGAGATARQLNDLGRQQATAIGDAFRELDIPVGRVISSEFCRNFTTAELMSFGPTIELEPAITYFVYDEDKRCTNSFALLRQMPAAGSNTAVIGHAGFSSTCDVLGTLQWGDAAIYRPDGDGDAELVTPRVAWNEWAALP
jgi:hypothetical protein